MEEAEDAIAVVGIGCNFPGGEGLENFWKVLVDGRNCSVPIPKRRFDLSTWYDPDENKAGKSRTAKAALIDGFNDFDHKFFGISDSEVEQMDPQQKQLLQCVYRALENAGIPMEEASGTKTGVFLGLMNRDYETVSARVHPSVINHWTGTGLAMSIAANRVSYIFNFTGPSLAIDSACSSSLVALHLACQAIKQGDCDMALCGGVNCIFEPRVFVALSKAKMISPEGTSRPFSRTADGYGRGEGCGVVLLKPLKKALQDHDHIWGIISKTAVNQDGHSVTPMTKPSMTQQEELLRRIYSDSDLVNVQYIEAHGTGTPVGDPTEAGSISNAIAKAKPPGSERLWIGSVKSNIGHTESAAGVAGLIKILLMMKHETIVPSVFYSEETDSVDAKALNLKVPQKAEKWATVWLASPPYSDIGVSSQMRYLDTLLVRVCLAAFNSPQSCTLSGDADAIKSFHAELSASANGQNLFLRLLNVPAAYHSHMMDPILKEIKETIGLLQVNNLDTELFSTVTGKEVQQGDFCTGEYWARNIREPVAFEQAVRLAAKGKKNTVFVEIAPRRALQRNIIESLTSDTAVLPSVQPGKDHETIMSVVSKLFELGGSGSESNIFSCDLKSDSSFYLKEHKHNNIPIIPGAFYAELGLAAVMASAKPKVPLNSLQLSVNFHSPCVLTQNSPDIKALVFCDDMGISKGLQSHLDSRSHATHLKFGQTLYWDKHSSQSHKLLALDFNGTVTAVGKDVRKLKVGDHVASCYPVVAASKVQVPEHVCYSTKRFPFLRKTPCVSYYVLAWEILQRALPRAKHHLGIISPVPDSALTKNVKSDSVDTFHPQKPESYFRSKKLAVVALQNDEGSVLSEIPVLSTKKLLFQKRAVYIVTGGLSGLGFETVKFISQRGGGYVVILSRSKPTPDLQTDIHNVENQCGNCITSMECDVSVSEHVHRVVSAIGQKFPGCPVRGVFHSAVVLHDGLIETLDRSLRNLGLPGQSINWGALNLGLLLNKDHFQQFLEAKGMMVLNLKRRLQKSKETDAQAKEAECISPKEFAISLLTQTIGIDPGELKDDSLLSSLGVDSMQAMTLQNLIFQAKGVNIPLVKLLDPNATVSTVVALLSEGAKGENVSVEAVTSNSTKKWRIFQPDCKDDKSI
ncbi:unnamed protein product [Pleuronectes platessa]|uniref:Carrier domain-containing protein n=1 Tax=Pleuronectes platessa TaxID=8262 RepID=A0A9N7ZEG1_PLEPL|nr:unnamed protein product [Pleuronectes platessa]